MAPCTEGAALSGLALADVIFAASKGAGGDVGMPTDWSKAMVGVYTPLIRFWSCGLMGCLWGEGGGVQGAYSASAHGHEN